jgi:HAD superfamily hydrolase (TIGR01549 family)
MFDNYIWDFDGTLYDSYPHIATAMLKMAKKHGIKGTYKEMKDALEIDYATACRVFKLTPEQIEEFRGYDHDYSLEPLVAPFEKTESVLKAVIESGKKNYIYTHRAKESTFYYLEKYGLQKYFSGIITRDDGFPPKPAPDALLSLAEKFNLDKSKSLMIGDREIDVAAGVNAGMTGCLITVKTNVSVAKYIFPDIGDILTLIGEF